MAHKKISHTQTVDYEVAGEQPAEQPFSKANSRIDPRSLRVTIRDGVLENIWVSGLKYNATGKLGKSKHSFPIGEEQYAPGWVKQIVSELGLTWPARDEDDA